MGQPVFEPLAVRRTEPVSNPTNTIAGVAKAMNTADTDMLLYCEGPSASAKAQYTEEGLVVLKGSRGRVEAAPSFGHRSAGKNRQRLIDSGVLLLNGSAYVFQNDVLFGSPSGASKVVLARSSNGWTEWKDASGKTLDELKRQKSDAAEGPD
jgi:hypothetical protein